ncbi:MAG TPA: hypothetical protein VKX28_27015 [Xanthobacteraceae bacterium]|nr:hypothetical protein [Xanthobacteraceae bacterium]
MPAPYIARIVAVIPDMNPRHVLAWMHSNTGFTLHQLSDDDFASHARYARACAAGAGAQVSERLASIMGI